MPHILKRSWLLSFITIFFVVALALTTVEARITKIVINRFESPTFGGASFGNIGKYEKIVGRAYGEVDPRDPLNAIITDIEKAPRNARGYVEYDTDFYILKPMLMSQSNGLLFYNVVNRGNKQGFNQLNFGVVGGNDPTTGGDGLTLKRGYTFLWSGWQADVLPVEGRMTFKAPVATIDGAEITGRVRAELMVGASANTLNLSSDLYTALSHDSYETISLDNSTATLTRRVREADLRIPIPNSDWAFADCNNVPFPGVPNTKKISLKGGFDPNYIYELIYTAKNPTVLGLGFAATRDVASFFRYSARDDFGMSNPLAGSIRAAIMQGNSQSGGFIRGFLDLGFNQDEVGRIVFEGMNIHIATRRGPLNIRFGQPGRATGQHEDHLYPGFESPFTWMPVYDPVAGEDGWFLERCYTTGTCPKIIQTVTSLEYWNMRMSLNTTDALGKKDIPIPDHIRIYLFSSTQHAPAATPAQGMCQQLNNPAPYNETLRALLVALERWVLEGVKPPPSQIPTLREKTLVPSDKASTGWPDIPGVKYTGAVSELTLTDYGPEFQPMNVSGIVKEPLSEQTGRKYTVLVPKVDADGNDIAGIRSTTIQAPLGTYTGWNLRRAGFAEDELCGLNGSYIPFRRTRAERMAVGDPRLSLEERYMDHSGYVAAVKRAADNLVAKGFLLPEDAIQLLTAAEASNVLR